MRLKLFTTNIFVSSIEPGPVVRFILPPEAVLKRVVHTLEAKNPQPNYYVTFSTYLLITLKRFLPHRAMDWVLCNVI
ncbi:MAG: hypothetical protein IMF12_05760 [Proteobacteria bacterium]|nr:hypothetical protein [Pseudomonadota bacterium]